MNKDKAKKLLDDISQSIHKLKEYEEYLCDNRTDGVHMSNCIRELAEVMELDVDEKPWKCDSYVATYISFVYQDIQFFELENYRKRDENAGDD